MKHATWGLIYWPVFILVTLAMFVPAEIIALVTNTYNTLSDYAWRELGLPLNDKPILYTAAWYFSFAVYLVVTVFLAIHIWFAKLR